MRRLVPATLLLCLPAAHAATDTVRQRDASGNVAIFNAVKVVGLERDASGAAFLALDYRERVGRFPVDTVVSVEFAPDRRFQMRVGSPEAFKDFASARAAAYADGKLNVALEEGTNPVPIALSTVLAMQAHDRTPPTVEETMAAANAGLDATAAGDVVTAVRSTTAEPESSEAVAADPVQAERRAANTRRKTLLFAVGGGALVLALLLGVVRMVRK